MNPRKSLIDCLNNDLNWLDEVMNDHFPEPRIGTNNNDGESIRWFDKNYNMMCLLISKQIQHHLMILRNERLRAHMDALTQAGIPMDPQLVITSRSTLLDYQTNHFGYASVNTLLTHCQDVTAIFTEYGEEAIHYLNEHSLRVPQDVSVISFSDSFELPAHFLGLSTITQDTNEIGRLAAEELIWQIEQGKADSLPLRQMLPTRLMVRQSTAPCRKSIHSFAGIA